MIATPDPMTSTALIAYSSKLSIYSLESHKTSKVNTESHPNIKRKLPAPKISA
jgi:hypothetical protein